MEIVFRRWTIVGVVNERVTAFKINLLPASCVDNIEKIFRIDGQDMSSLEHVFAILGIQYSWAILLSQLHCSNKLSHVGTEHLMSHLDLKNLMFSEFIWKIAWEFEAIFWSHLKHSFEHESTWNDKKTLNYNQERLRELVAWKKGRYKSSVVGENFQKHICSQFQRLIANHKKFYNRRNIPRSVIQMAEWRSHHQRWLTTLSAVHRHSSLKKIIAFIGQTDQQFLSCILNGWTI